MRALQVEDPSAGGDRMSSSVFCHVMVSLDEIEAVKQCYPELRQLTASGVIENLVQRALSEGKRLKRSVEPSEPQSPISK